MKQQLQKMADRLRKNQKQNLDYERLESQSNKRIKRFKEIHEERDKALRKKKYLLTEARLNCARVPFSDYDFLRAFLASIKMNGQFSFNKDLLRYQLYEYYNLEEYHDLFQDIAVKHQISGNFLDMEEAIQNAVLYGLITPHDMNHKRLILINEEEAQEILSSYDEKIVKKMDNLAKLFSQNKIIRKKKI